MSSSSVFAWLMCGRHCSDRCRVPFDHLCIFLCYLLELDLVLLLMSVMVHIAGVTRVSMLQRSAAEASFTGPMLPDAWLHA